MPDRSELVRALRHALAERDAYAAALGEVAPTVRQQMDGGIARQRAKLGVSGDFALRVWEEEDPDYDAGA